MRGLTRRRLLLGAGGATAGAAVVGAVVVHYRRPRPVVMHKVVLDGRARRMVLSWPSSNRLLFHVAQARFFGTYNLDVTLVDGARTGRTTIADVVEGRAVGAAAPILTWLDRYRLGPIPVHLVTGLQSGGFRLLVRRGVKGSRLDNVAGMRIAVTDQDMADRLFFSVMMRRKGINPDDAVHWVTLAPAQIEDAARAGEIDAVAAHDPLAWQWLHAPDPLFFELANSTTGHYSQRTNLALGLSDALLRSDPVGAASLVMALRAASDWVRQHPDEAAGLMAEATDGMDAAQILAMLRHESLGISPVGHDLRVQVSQYVDEMKLLDRVPDAVGSAAYARRLCVNVLEADESGALLIPDAGPA
ncbi:ABC transporter substrate-binding protein [Gluconacetobacter sp. 1b LMG 1731]|uniref:ABC transporter substrate-binding protein n=1 Tax=Gluconacetobacter dulcium TaxID=2729096 RepID=A0A7W4IKE5_9PROT|nr:ABC transporter substrate-binding protein [Gluconacetobacter dulcium]MBB2164466.1 ABC transporter substrate-binding protein [Gluconacetobacter dulcium]MBB2193464.1 ABC transporter substrate-binding protein [Gluconacetobacter dulcium]